MKAIKTIKYFSEEDVLYIPLSDKKSLIGDEDFQDNVILYKIDNEVVGIEIQNFSEFKETTLRISNKKVLDLTEPFKAIKMVISLFDIIEDDPKQFKDTLEAWGFKFSDKLPDVPATFNMNVGRIQKVNFSYA
jgi:uncharacterized protein YuzE